MTNDQRILGSASVSQESAVQWVRSRGADPKLTCDLEELVRYYWEEGAKEGVRPDLLLCLSVWETGWFQYGGIVSYNQNNFGGLGAFNGNAAGQAAEFPDARTGVRAVVQHAKGYATKTPPSQPCADPRYAALVAAGWLGSSPRVHGLSGKWAVPGYDSRKFSSLAEAYRAEETYGQNITRLYDSLMAFADKGGEGMRIAFCAGHGKHTPGKRSPADEREWDFNRQNAIAFENALRQYRGVRLLRTDDRTGRTDVPLQERTDRANQWGAGLYVSFHHNAYRGSWGKHTGSEVYYWDGNNSWTDEAEKVANRALLAALHAYGLRNRGVKRYDFHICREMKCPSVLIEGGFMDSTVDIEILRQPILLERLGELVAKEVAEFYGLKKKVATKRPRWGVFVQNEADEAAANAILSRVRGAVKFDWKKTPTEMFDAVIQVGGDALRSEYTLLAGKDRAETMEKVRLWIAENETQTTSD